MIQRVVRVRDLLAGQPLVDIGIGFLAGRPLRLQALVAAGGGDTDLGQTPEPLRAVDRAAIVGKERPGSELAKGLDGPLWCCGLGLDSRIRIVPLALGQVRSPRRLRMNIGPSGA
jgi:hypothetical protein